MGSAPRQVKECVRGNTESSRTILHPGREGEGGGGEGEGGGGGGEGGGGGGEGEGEGGGGGRGEGEGAVGGGGGGGLRPPMTMNGELCLQSRLRHRPY